MTWDQASALLSGLVLILLLFMLLRGIWRAPEPDGCAPRSDDITTNDT